MAGRSVVVAVDASDAARDAARWAAELATAWGAPLRLVHVADRPDVPAWLRGLAGSAEVEVIAGPVIASSVVTVLADRSADARMLVLGSYGSGAASGMQAGTVAMGMIDRIGCPIAVVRGPTPGVPPSHAGPVVVGVDGSSAGSDALLRAAGLAAVLSTGLVIVHTWSEVEVVAHRGVVRHPVGAEGSAAAVLAAATAAVADAGVPVECELVAGTPVRALLECARTARLLVVGHRGTDPGTGMMHGSTSKALVAFAPCPVVVTCPR